ncbi:TetR/AcrR family transcriptional regulator [Halobacterium jilantaiense]|uniref:Transcriptional regulator, TetR family n=1 Tax=Halobacterium jilantaiense TaxID=355548 RepID=A0A1I0MFA7_9EURY|nr:TetR/AcrR family transcriptional regulator [Halobacterium jilantaiense]SEV86808.1 transcriptional regulator, TetR family [Halobacterium jilantaiense]
MSEADAEGEDLDTEDLIMQATYRALCEHGYPATSISKIADEFEKSKALLYHHYDDKEDLLAHFLTYLLDQFETELEQNLPTDHRQRLTSVVDQALPEVGEADEFQFRRALLEMRSQAPYHEAYHDRFVHSDELILQELRDTIEAGIEAGEFQDVDPAETSQFLYTLVYGALERDVPLGDEAVTELTREQIHTYISEHVYK